MPLSRKSENTKFPFDSLVESFMMLRNDTRQRRQHWHSTSARHLSLYFLSHQVVVKTEHPIRQVLQKPELARRMVAWSVELLEFDLKYEPHSPVKTQFMADFLVKFTGTSDLPQTGGTCTQMAYPMKKKMGQELSQKGPLMLPWKRPSNSISRRQTTRSNMKHLQQA